MRGTKKVMGVGIYESGEHAASEGGKPTKGYSTWTGMLERCYSSKHHERFPTYVGCSADARFHHFQDFMKWAVRQTGYNIGGYQLDKDLLVKGNKVYSPETCAFIPKEINFLLGKKSRRGDYCIGVSLFKRDMNYKAQIVVKGKTHHIGYFDTEEDAFHAYKEAKERNIKDMAEEYKSMIDTRVYEAMLLYTVENTD